MPSIEVLVGTSRWDLSQSYGGTVLGMWSAALPTPAQKSWTMGRTEPQRCRHGSASTPGKQLGDSRVASVGTAAWNMGHPASRSFPAPVACLRTSTEVLSPELGWGEGKWAVDTEAKMPWGPPAGEYKNWLQVQEPWPGQGWRGLPRD